MAIHKVDFDAKPPDWIGASWGVIDGIIEGDESIDHLCQVWDIPPGTFYRTVMKHPDLREALQVARKVRAQRYADQAVELSRPAKNPNGSSADWQMDTFGRYTANSGLINRDALRIKTLLHLASKLDPEQFGDRIIQDQRGGEKAMLVIGDTAKAAALIAQARLARLATPVDQSDSAPAVSDPKQLKSEAVNEQEPERRTEQHPEDGDQGRR